MKKVRGLFFGYDQVGCGIGTFLADARNAGWTMSGLEINTEFRDFSRKELGIEDVKIGLVSDPPFSEASFDAVAMLDILEHTSRSGDCGSAVCAFAKARWPAGGEIAKRSYAASHGADKENAGPRERQRSGNWASESVHSQDPFSGISEMRARTGPDPAGAEFSGRDCWGRIHSASRRPARWSRNGECLDASDRNWIESGGRCHEERLKLIDHYVQIDGFPGTALWPVRFSV